MKIEKKLLEIPINIFKNIILEPVIEFNNGFKIISKDPANVCMCIFELNKNKFIEYKLEKPERFSISLKLFDKILKRIKTDFIILKFENQQLIILDDKNKKQFNMAIMDGEETQEIPNLNFTSEINISAKELTELFLDVSMVSDNFKIETKEGKIIISGGELNKYNSEIENNSIGCDSAKFSLEYINKFMVSSKIFENVKFEFSSNNPCRLSFENEDLKIQFILAPRIEND